MLSVFFFFCFCSQIKSQNVSSHPSDINIRPYVETLKHIVDEMEETRNDARERLQHVTEYLKHYTNEHTRLLSDRKTYLGNPINRFTFLYSLTKGLESVREITKGRRVFKKDSSLRYPNRADVEIHVMILSKIQRIYKLNVTQLAAGILNTSYSENGEVYVEHFSKMTSSDCFTMGIIMQKYRQYRESIPWLVEALKLYGSDETCDFDKGKIYWSLFNTYELLGDSKNLLKWAEELILHNKRHLDQEMANLIITHRSKLEYEMSQKANKITQRKQNKWKSVKEVLKCTGKLETSNFRKHCRGEMGVPTEMTKRLNCWYSTGYHPFLRLAPIRTEQLYVTPDIFLHHDVITQTEIDNITLKGELSECEYLKSENCTNNTVRKCLQTIAFRNCLTKKIRAPANSITQRIFDLTGLWSPAEDPVANYYSSGGHFFTHVDTQRQATYINCALEIEHRMPNFSLIRLNRNGSGAAFETTQAQKAIVFNMCLYRVQTMLFYLSDVTQGGATVFPILGLTVFPKKGSALSWTNMYPPSSHDVTCHSACPVLRGNKWVLTKWVNFDGNELRRPCVHQFPNGLSMFTPPPVTKDAYYKIL